jgi:hypothetical protein
MLVAGVGGLVIWLACVTLTIAWQSAMVMAGTLVGFGRGVAVGCVVAVGVACGERWLLCAVDGAAHPAAQIAMQARHSAAMKLGIADST